MSSLLNRAKSLKSGTSATPKAKHYDKNKQRPSDDLLARYNQFNNINKSLIDFFTASRDSEQHTSKEISKQASAIPVPFAEGDQFVQDEHGFQNMLYKLRDHTRAMAELHNSFAHTIDNDVLSLLNENKSSLKYHLDEMNKDLGKESDLVDKEREHSTNSLGEYGRSVSMIDGNGLGATHAKSDPFITHGIVERQLLKQLEHENKLTRSTIKWQRTSESFEENLVYKIHQASERFTAAQLKHNERLQALWSQVGSQLVSVDSKKEWEHYANPEHGRIVDPQTTMRDPSLVTFPNQGHHYSKPLKEGLLERKKRHTKKYEEYYMVLTPAGFLHEYPASGITGDDPKAFNPALSLYLPEYTLSAPSSPTDKKHKFYVEGMRKSASGKDSSHGFRKKKEVAYTFKARSHVELMQWWEACDSLTKRSLSSNAPSSPARNTPTNHTVASVGYAQSTRDPSLAESSPSRRYATPEPSISPVVQREAAAERAHEEEEEEEESDDASIGGSSVEEEQERAAGAAFPAPPVVASTGEVHPNHQPISSTLLPHHEAVPVQHEQTVPVHVEQAPGASRENELAPAIGLPSYHGGAAENHGYPIDKKVGFANDPVDHQASASSVPHQDLTVPASNPVSTEEDGVLQVPAGTSQTHAL